MQYDFFFINSTITSASDYKYIYIYIYWSNSLIIINVLGSSNYNFFLDFIIISYIGLMWQSLNHFIGQLLAYSNKIKDNMIKIKINNDIILENKTNN